MKREEQGFLKGRMTSFGNAFRGIHYLIIKERNFKLQLLIAVVVTLAGWLVGLTVSEWMMQILAIGLVLAAEAGNTAVEKLCDFVHESDNRQIGLIKDIAAGGVTLAALAAAVIGLVIYVPKFL